MTELFEQNRNIKLILIGLLLLLMLFMIFTFPSSQATSDDNYIVSIR